MAENTTAYYERTAKQYDQMHGENNNPEHTTAMVQSWNHFRRLDVRSVIDVGCGTGRSLQWIHERDPDIELSGVDPAESLLDIARDNLPHATFRVGQGESLPFEDNSCDIAMASAIMHHVDDPKAVVAEMFRVSRKGILISDHNNFAFGSRRTRRLRLLLYSLGLLNVVTFIKQGFRKQGYSEADGWWYPYSLFNQIEEISDGSDQQWVLPTRPIRAGGMNNMMLDMSHFAVLATVEQV